MKTAPIDDAGPISPPAAGSCEQDYLASFPVLSFLDASIPALSAMITTQLGRRNVTVLNKGRIAVHAGCHVPIGNPRHSVRPQQSHRP